MDACRAGFDAETDKLAVRFRDFGIVRVPMVGTGKKNIHFDPHGSPCFAAMAALAHAGRFEDLLKKYWVRTDGWSGGHRTGSGRTRPQEAALCCILSLLAARAPANPRPSAGIDALAPT